MTKKERKNKRKEANKRKNAKENRKKKNLYCVIDSINGSR